MARVVLAASVLACVGMLGWSGLHAYLGWAQRGEGDLSDYLGMLARTKDARNFADGPAIWGALTLVLLAQACFAAWLGRQVQNMWHLRRPLSVSSTKTAIVGVFVPIYNFIVIGKLMGEIDRGNAAAASRPGHSAIVRSWLILWILQAVLGLAAIGFDIAAKRQTYLPHSSGFTITQIVVGIVTCGFFLLQAKLAAANARNQDLAWAAASATPKPTAVPLPRPAAAS